MPLALSEKQVQRQIIDYLTKVEGWWALVTDPVSDPARGKGFGELGMADAQFIRYSYDPGAPYNRSDDIAKERYGRSWAQVLWVECKRPGGRDLAGRKVRAGAPTKHQLEWHEAVRALGALTCIMGKDCPATLDGFMAWYEAGALRRRPK